MNLRNGTGLSARYAGKSLVSMQQNTDTGLRNERKHRVVPGNVVRCNDTTTSINPNPLFVYKQTTSFVNTYLKNLLIRMFFRAIFNVRLDLLSLPVVRYLIVPGGTAKEYISTMPIIGWGVTVPNSVDFVNDWSVLRKDW